jgi:hypothetical protein
MTDIESNNLSLEALNIMSDNVTSHKFYEVREAVSWKGSKKCYLRGMIDPQSWEVAGIGTSDYTLKLYDVIDPNKFIMLIIEDGPTKLEDFFEDWFVPQSWYSKETIALNADRWDDDWEQKKHEVVLKVFLYGLDNPRQSECSNGTVYHIFMGLKDFKSWDI